MALANAIDDNAVASIIKFGDTPGRTNEEVGAAFARVMAHEHAAQRARERSKA